MAKRGTAKAKLSSEFQLNVLKLPRVYMPNEGVYFSLDGMKLIMADMKGKTKGPAAKPTKPETKEEIHKRITKRFHALGEYTGGAVKGAFKALFIQGPPGLGKSFETEKMLKEYDPNGINTTIIKGKMTPVGLVKQLWDHRQKGQILCIDDCDAIFFDDTSLNLLKAATDSTKKRTISYMTESTFVSEKDGSVVDKRFEFEGTIIFITNYDFDDLIEKGHRLAPHFEAIKDRAHYVTLGMKTRKDYMVRVEQIADMGLFNGRSAGTKADVLGFMWKNLDQLDGVNARMASKLSDLREAFPKSWEVMAAESCFRKEGH